MTPQTSPIKRRSLSAWLSTGSGLPPRDASRIPSSRHCTRSRTTVVLGAYQSLELVFLGLAIDAQDVRNSEPEPAAALAA